MTLLQFPTKPTLDALRREREFQLTKHREWHAENHTIAEWLGLICSEHGEVMKSFFSMDYDEIMSETLQLATLCLAFLEAHWIQERNYEEELKGLKNDNP